MLFLHVSSSEKETVIVFGQVALLVIFLSEVDDVVLVNEVRSRKMIIDYL